MNSSIFLVIIFLLASCKKEGYTDLHALNYDNEATKDNGSCNYQSERFVGLYNLTDNFYGGMIPDKWISERTYTIEIKQDYKNNSQLVIINWANLRSNTADHNENSIQVFAEVEENTFMIANQDILNTDDYMARASQGELIGDSIYFNFEYTNFFGEVFWGAVSGKRIE